MVGKTVQSSAAEIVRYQQQNLSRDHYNLEEGKVWGEFVGVLADEWGLSTKAIVKDDARFRAFAELNLARLSGQTLGRPRRSERQAIEFAYSAPKSVGIAAVHDARIAGGWCRARPHLVTPRRTLSRDGNNQFPADSDARAHQLDFPNPRPGWYPRNCASDCVRRLVCGQWYLPRPLRRRALGSWLLRRAAQAQQARPRHASGTG